MMKMLRRLSGWIREIVRGCPRAQPGRWRHRDVLVVAHRGACASVPENTIAALDAALTADRCTAVEVDLSFTSDGHVVLWHDWDPDSNVALARQAALEAAVGFRPVAPSIGSALRCPVNSVTLAQLREHYGYGPKTAISSRLGDARIPTFREFVEWSLQRPELQFVILDIKVPSNALEVVEPMLRAVERTFSELQPRFDYMLSTPVLPVLQEMERVSSHEKYAYDVEPPIGLILRPGRFSSVAAAIRMRNAYGTSVAPMVWTFAPWTTYRRIIRKDVKLRERHNARNPDVPVRRVFAATINDPEQITCLLGLGVDGIITDRPEIVREAAARVGRPVC